MRRLGRIKLSQDLLLTWLDYSEAIIRDAHYDIEAQTVDLVLESVDMPRVEDGDVIPIVSPVYIMKDNRAERVRRLE